MSNVCSKPAPTSTPATTTEIHRSRNGGGNESATAKLAMTPPGACRAHPQRLAKGSPAGPTGPRSGAAASLVGFAVAVWRAWNRTRTATPVRFIRRRRRTGAGRDTSKGAGGFPKAHIRPRGLPTARGREPEPDQALPQCRRTPAGWPLCYALHPRLRSPPSRGSTRPGMDARTGLRATLPGTDASILIATASLAGAIILAAVGLAALIVNVGRGASGATSPLA